MAVAFVAVYPASSCTAPSFGTIFAAVLENALAAILDAALAAARSSTLASTVGAALGWLWQASSIVGLLLAIGDEGGEGCVRLRRQPGTGTVDGSNVPTRPLLRILSPFALQLSCGTLTHMKHLLDCLRYTYQTRGYQLTWGPGRSDGLFQMVRSTSLLRPDELKETSLIAFTDASHGGEKPMAGYALLFFGGLINWCAQRLQMTTLSSCQAEYVAATNATVSILAARALLQFVGALKEEQPTILLCDKTTAQFGWRTATPPPRA